MQRTQFGDMTCSIARTLDLIGEPWSPLILRDVMVGIRRFDQIQADLGISRKVLTERLKWLVDCGVLDRLEYTARPPRYEYVLTDKGKELRVALAALRQWGDAYCGPQPPTLMRSKADGGPVVAAFVPAGAANILGPDEVVTVPGPGA